MCRRPLPLLSVGPACLTWVGVWVSTLWDPSRRSSSHSVRFTREPKRRADSLQLIQEAVASSPGTQRSVWRRSSSMAQGPQESPPLPGDCEFKTTFLTIQGHHLPFSLSFSCEWAVEFFPEVIIATDGLEKQIRESSCLLLSQTLDRFVRM